MRKDEDQLLALKACYTYQQNQKKTIDAHEHTITDLQQVVTVQQQAIAQLSQILKSTKAELDEAKASLSKCECKGLDKTKGEGLMRSCAHAICLQCIIKSQKERQ